MAARELVAQLASECGVGTVALVGAHARGDAPAAAPLEVFATVPLRRVTHFGQRLAEEMDGIVRVYDCRRVSWAHPLHLCARWLNVVRLPSLPCPRGAVARWRCPRTGVVAAVRLETLPHFHAVDGYVPTQRGEFVRVFGPPPMGGFLV